MNSPQGHDDYNFAFYPSGISRTVWTGESYYLATSPSGYYSGAMAYPFESGARFMTSSGDNILYDIGFKDEAEDSELGSVRCVAGSTPFPPQTR